MFIPACQWLLSFAFCLLCLAPALAGTLDRAGMEKLFPDPLMVGEMEASLPAWPIFVKEGPGGQRLLAYVFESVDLAPIPGFSGTVPNLLIAITPDGTYQEVKVLSHHEPVFLEGLGEDALFAFVKQYGGLSMKTPVKVASSVNRKTGKEVIDGVAKATASVRIINETILAASYKVAKAKLGFGGDSANQKPAATIRKEAAQPVDIATLENRGLLKTITISDADAEKAFTGTGGEGLDSEAAEDGAFTSLSIAVLTVPQVEQSLMDERMRRKLSNSLRDERDVAILVASKGRWLVTGEDFVPGTAPARVSILQNGTPFEAKDLAIDTTRLTGFAEGEGVILRINGAAGFDPGQPITVQLNLERKKGQLTPEIFTAAYPLTYQLPDDVLDRAIVEAEASGWQAVWLDRKIDIALILGALVLLGAVLALQNRTTANGRFFAAFRWAFLTFTLVFIGWYAQAQVSILNIVSMIKSAWAGQSLAFMLYDPPTLIVMAFAVLSLAIWGRGTFCGWLCPFGALQEFTGEIARRMKIRQWRIAEPLDQKLRLLKYLPMIGILAASFASGSAAETLAEIEPFKTSITLGFVRAAPFVVYAFALLVLSLFVYKGFCRYLCPLGAALAAVGVLRRWDWIARKVECGTPCRLCERRCRYGAISSAGVVNYTECFQCMDCVVIHNDPKTCVPDVQKAKVRRPPIRIKPHLEGNPA